MNTVYQLKVLIVILTMTVPVFFFAKPVCLRFMDEADFLRRRNIWLALTATALLSPSFWLYALVAAILFTWGARKDATPAAFYLLLLHVIPPGGQEIPYIGSIRIFELDNYRLLAFTVLIPVAWKFRQLRHGDDLRRFTLTDTLVLGFCLLQLVLLAPYESITNTARRGLLSGLDVLIPYYVFSRSLTDKRAFADTLCTFCLACALFAGIATFEALRTWPLYGETAEIWGLQSEGAYVFRGTSLRALASSGHPLALGYMMSIGFGFWLYLRPHAGSMWKGVTIAGWMWLGLLAAYSRAPWLVAIIIFFIYLWFQNRGAVKTIKALLALACVGGIVLASPLGSKVIDNLPFVGTVDSDNVVYRQRLADVSWRLIEQNPLLGDPFVLNKMEEMRQGEGIIDLVNTYATMALFYGMIGLSIFCCVFASGAWKLFQGLRRANRFNEDTARIGANLLACLLGTLVMMATGSFGSSLALLAWALAGLSVSYERMVQRMSREAAQ
jgi:hypothetical protein